MEVIPETLDRVGKHKAEVISEQELQKRYAGKYAAPALATLHVETDTGNAEGDLRVLISYRGAPVVGAQAIPIGGSKTYWFNVQNGKAKLVRAVSMQY